MSDSIDDLLAQIKADNRSRSVPDSPMSTPSEPEDSLDALLAELDGRSTLKPNTTVTPQSASPKYPSPNQRSNSQRSNQRSNSQNSAHRTNHHPTFNSQPTSQPAPADTATDNLLADLKAIYTEQDRAEQQRQATFRRQKQAAVVRQAETWLKSLDGQSSEAAWFEEFAAKYNSRVEAAIDYLGLKIE